MTDANEIVVDCRDNRTALMIPGSFRDVLPDTGHLIYLEKLLEFFNEVDSFLTVHEFQTER